MSETETGKKLSAKKKANHNPSIARLRKEHQLDDEKRHDSLIYWVFVVAFCLTGICVVSFLGLFFYFSAIGKQAIADQYMMYLLVLLTHAMSAVIGAFVVRRRAPA